MSIETFLEFRPVFINLLVTFVSALITFEISRRTINANKNLNDANAKVTAENAGKNRVIYNVEEVIIGSSRNGFQQLNEKLNSESYTILAVSTDLGNNSQRIYTLGKIKP